MHTHAPVCREGGPGTRPLRCDGPHTHTHTHMQRERHTHTRAHTPAESRCLMLSSPRRNLSHTHTRAHTDGPAYAREDNTNNGKWNAGEEMGVSALEAGLDTWLTAEVTSESQRVLENEWMSEQLVWNTRTEGWEPKTSVPNAFLPPQTPLRPPSDLLHHSHHNVFIWIDFNRMLFNY